MILIKSLYLWRLDDVVYIFGYYGWGLCIKRRMGHRECINPPCDVDRLCGRNEWQIKELEQVVMPGGSDNNRYQRCACMSGTSLGVLSAGRIMIMVIGLFDCGGALWAALIG